MDGGLPAVSRTCIPHGMLTSVASAHAVNF